MSVSFIFSFCPFVLFSVWWVHLPVFPSEFTFRALAAATGFRGNHFCRGGRCGTRAFRKSEIQLAGNQISLYHFHEYLISELVHFPVVTATDAVVFFVEFVIVSFQFVDRNKSFAFGVIQFHVEPPLLLRRRSFP